MKKTYAPRTSSNLITFGIAWPLELYKKIAKDAEKRKVSMGAVVKEIVEHYYKKKR